MKSKVNRPAPGQPMPAMPDFNSTPVVKTADNDMDATSPGERAAAIQEASNVLTGTAGVANEVYLPVKRIKRGKFQPRRHFPENKIADLAKSIESNSLNGQDGMWHAITVRKIEGDPDFDFELIAGERRLKAHLKLEKELIRAVVRNLSDQQACIESLGDNDARSELTDFERGLAYDRAIMEQKIPASVLSAQIGVPESAISRCRAFLKLPDAAVEILKAHPEMVGGSSAVILAKCAKDGHGELVVKALQKLESHNFKKENGVIKDEGFEEDEEDLIVNSERACLDWLEGQIRRLQQKPAPVTARPFLLNGVHTADIRIEGRKIVLSCAKGVNPEDIIEKFQSLS